MENSNFNIPVLALRGLNVFPQANLSFDVERRMSINAVEHAMEGDQKILLVTQKEIGTDVPEERDLFKVGTVAYIRQILRLNNNMVRVMVEGLSRAKINRLWQTSPYIFANIDYLEEEKPSEAFLKSPRTEALLRKTWNVFAEYASLASNLSDDVITTVMDSKDLGFLADYIAQNTALPYTEKQEVLNELSHYPRLLKVNELLAKECHVLGFEHELEGKVRETLTSQHRDQMIRTQIHVLQNELGENEDDEIENYREAILSLGLEEAIEKKLLKEVNKLSKQPFGSAEASVIRNYLDTCLEIPWNTTTKERLNIEVARKVLEKDHYGLEKVKERILETLAVRQMNPEGKGQIICLVGPPGVGKTSIALSVANALNRKLSRISLGGVRDEADIRGHRKTYVGAMPGRIIEAISQSGSMNPLIVLDEIDKMGNDYRGDPAAALLEVLDSEQNHSFRDHFVEIPVNLHKVMFITTANTTSTIPTPLLDRMEVIELGSYTDEEKLQIARKHLLPKQMAEHGLAKGALRISDDVIRTIIRDYTRESGVRKLERKIASVCRKADMKMLREGVKRITITTAMLPNLLDAQPYPPTLHSVKDEIGVVNGLAWTSVGGEILEVEVNVMDGNGKIELTGNLGNVMKESVQAAISCIRSRAKDLNINPEFYKNRDIHVHFPEGAVPKDGPSAGITISTAVLSALSNRPVRSGIAMTGEVTLRGRVLPIGGLKEKTMAAYRYGIHTVIIPKDNERDLADIDSTVREKLKFIAVSSVDEVFDAALLPIEIGSPAEIVNNMPIIEQENSNNSVIRQ